MLEILLIVSVLAVDQITKYLTDLYLSPLGTSLPLIPGVFHLTSAHNTGAAWGMLPGKRWFFLVLTVVIAAFIVWFLVRYRGRMTLLSRITLSLLLSGAVGNAIDRAALSYVRDMFDFCLIRFPVFNVADSALTVGCILLVIDVLFLKEKSIFEIRLREPKVPAKPEDGEKSAHADG